jgi:hypothetical protein
MAAVVTQEHDPFLDGLGKASNVGVGFLRRVHLDFDDDTDVTKTLTPADLGCAKFLRVISIVPHSVETSYVSAFSESSLTVTVSADTAVLDLFVLVSGL